MSYGRLEEGGYRPDRIDNINVTNPKHVARHDCDGHELLLRHRDEAARVLREGKKGLERVAPYLLERLADTRTLRQAWDYLCEHGGQSPGPDGSTYSDLSKDEIWRCLRAMRDELLKGTYRPGPERVIEIAKGPGRGTRTLAIQDIYDRVVQRAVVEIAQPLLDSRFDSRSFGFRPKRGAHLALGHARQLFKREDRKIWVTQDVRDAFTNVPVPRLLQVVRKYLVSGELTDLIKRVLSNATTSGLRQGGSLSPLLLNLYLHHHLDVPWRKLNPDIPLLRYADDLLLMCKSVKEARMAHDSLVDLLRPAGMPLKCNRKTAIRRLTAESPAEWLGFRIVRRKKALRIEVGERGWQRLEDALVLAAEEPESEEQVQLVLNGWLSAMGPAYRHVDHDAAYRRIAAAVGDAPLSSAREVEDRWQRAYARWRKALRSTPMKVDRSTPRAHRVSRAAKPNDPPADAKKVTEDPWAGYMVAAGAADGGVVTEYASSSAVATPSSRRRRRRSK